MKQLTTKILQGRGVLLLLFIFISGAWSNHSYAGCDFDRGTITSAVAQACAGETVTLTHGSYDSAINRQWQKSVNGGAWTNVGTLNATTYSEVILETTTYRVRMTDDCDDTGTQYTANFTITVLTPVADAGPNKSIACGLGGTLIGSPPPNGLFTYSWSPTAGLSNPSVAQPLANPTSTQTYTLTVSCGSNSATSQTTVTVDQFPIDAGPDKSIACGGNVELEGDIPILVPSTPPLANSNCVGTSDPLDDDHISMVRSSGALIDFYNQFNGYGANGYTDYTNRFSVVATPNSTFTLSFTTGDYNNGVRVWVDWNNDGIFQESESVYSAGLQNGYHTYSTIINVPASQPPGEYRIRVRAVYNTIPEAGDACKNFDYGETEDYILRVAEPIGSSENVYEANFNSNDNGFTTNANGFVRATTFTNGGETITNGGTNFFYLRSDGSGKPSPSWLQSPAFSTEGYENLKFSFRHYFRQAAPANNSRIFVRFSTDATNWTDLEVSQRFESNFRIGTYNNFATYSVVLPKEFENKPTVYTQFYYIHSNDWSWSIDDIIVTGYKIPIPELSWSGGPIVSGENTLNPIVNPSSTTTYTLTVVNGICTSTDDVEVTVNALPVVSIDPVSDLCEDNAVITLVGTPNGGTFSGNGITGDDFDASVAGIGTHTITYEYTDGNGCENSATTTIVVKEVPNYTVNFTNPTTCGGDEGTITLAGLNAGDSYDVNYNNGIAVTYTADVNGEILITDLEAGTYTDFEVTLDGCPKLDNTIITLEDPDAPTVNAGSDEVLCENEEVTLTATNPDGAVITWNNGVTDGTPFTPTVGTTTYTVTAVLNGCTSTDDVEVTVNALPVVSIDPVADLCEDNAVITLVGTPNGGTFSGNGITGDDFDPSLAGVGTHTITYEYTDGNTCENSVTTTIVVKEVPNYTVSFTNPTTCGGDEGTITLTGLNAGDSYDVNYNNGVAVTYTADVNGEIVITDLEAGTYTDFEVTLDGCPKLDNTIITLEDPDAPVVNAGSDEVLCENEEVTLTATNPDGAIITWNNGITDGTPFTPTVGTTTYTVTAVLNGCTSTDDVEVTVNALPVVSIDPVADLCEDNAAITLVGTPNGGTFSGNGITGDDFDPSLAGVGTHTITYEYTDGNTCENSATTTIVVKEVPNYTVNFTNPTTCGGTEGTITLAGLNAGDSYDVNYNNGIAVTYTADVNGEIVITDLEAGTYTDFEVLLDGCPKLDNMIITLEDPDAPTVNAGSDEVLCENEEVTLTATNPDGAIITWNNGVTDGTPFTPTVGTTTYTVTAVLNGCTSTDDVEVTVNALPVVSIDPVADLCEDNDAVIIKGNPDGGTFSGNGITGDEFDASVAGVGTHTITYEYTDGNGCENSATTTIVVKEVPNYTVSFTNPTTCGGDEGTITLTGLNAGDSYDVNYNNGVAVTYTADVNGEIVITDLEAGTYTDFEVTLDGCPKLDNTIITLEDPDAPVVNAGSDEVLCENEEVTLTASNPDGAVITWNNGITDGTPFTPTVGTTTYTVTAVLNGCTSTDDVEVTVNALPVVSIDPVADLCEDNAVLTLVGTPNGGTFSGNGITGDDFDASLAGVGTHTITYEYTDGNTCENSATTTIVVKEVPNYTVSFTNPTTCGGDEGTITLAGLNAGDSYDVNYNNGVAVTYTADVNGEIVITDLEAGTYTDFEVTLDGCPKLDNTIITLEDPDAPVVNAGLDEVLCENEEVTLTATNPDGATITWNNGVTDGTPFTPTVGTTTYTVTAVLNGCTSTDDVEVTVNALPVVSIDPIADLCEDNAVITLVGTPNGGTFSGNGITGDDFDPSLAGVGTHTITYEYTDGNTCENSVTTTIVVKEVPNYTVNFTNPTTCGGDEGTITLTGLNAGDSYDVNYNNGVAVTYTADVNGEIVITDLEAGTYTDFEVLLDGCPKIDNTIITLEDPDAPTVNAGSDEVLCENEEVTLTATNPDGAVITWNNGVTDGTPFTPTVGTTTYTVTAVLNGCTSTDDVEVTVNALPVVSIDPVADLCEDNAVITLVGTPNGGTFSGNGITGDDFDPSLAGVGTHTITYEYTDGNTCENSATTTIVVKEVPNYTVNFTNPTTCGGTEGTITLTGLNAGDSYDVNYNNGIAVTYTADVNGEIVITDLEAGTYTDFEVLLDGCPKLDNTIITLEDPDAPVVNAGLDEVLCENEEVTLTATNPDGAVITWNNGVTDGTPFTPTVGTTTYTVTVVLNGCTSTDDVEVTVNALPVVSINPVADLCEDNAVISLVGTPNGGTFSGNGITGDDFDASLAGVGTHTITYEYTDGNTCENSATTTIVVKEVPNYTVSFTNPTTCGGTEGTITLAGLNAGDSYDVNYNNGIAVTYTADVNGEIVITDLEAGTYTDFEVLLDGCPKLDNTIITLEDPDAPTVNAGSDEVLCENEEVTLTATNPDGAIITWNNGITDGTPFTPTVGTTTYTVTAVLNGCTSTDDVEVTVNALPVVSIDPVADLCEDNAVITLVGTPNGGTFSGNGITGDDFDPSLAGVGTHTITYEYTDGNTCENSATTTIVVKEVPNYTVNFTNPTTCGGTEGTITLAGLNAGDSYDVNYNNGIAVTYTADVNGEIVITDLEAGTYTDFEVLLDGCPKLDNTIITLEDPDAPTVNAGSDEVLCENEEVTLTATNPDGAIITWNNGITDGTPFTPTVGTTTYTVTAVLNGCTSTDDVEVTVNALPIVSIDPVADLCINNDLVTLSGNPIGGTFSGVGINGNNFDPSIAGIGTHIITYDYTDGNGCENSSTTTIVVNDIPTLSAETQYSVCSGENVTMTVDSPSSSNDYYWYFDEDLVNNGANYTIQDADLMNDGNYILVAQNSNGCFVEMDVTLSVDICNINITEVFSPNGDGKNDYFVVENLSMYPNSELWIYNKWGDEVYNSSNYLNDWNGLSQNALNIGEEELPEGTYYYVLKLGGDISTPNAGNVYKGFVYLKR